jgi:carboxymethylenebutenolidase
MTAHTPPPPGHDVRFATPRGEVPGFAVLPPNPRGAVVVVHEIFGRQPEIDAVALRFGAAGHAALVPDLFQNRFKPLCIARSMRQIHAGHGDDIDVLKAAGAWLAEQTGLPPARVGVIGFCLGGGFALAVGNAFGAVSTNYGDIPKDPVLKGLPPTIGCYGKNDPVYGKHGQKLEATLVRLGVPHEVHSFDAGHAFLCDGDHPVAAALTKPILNVNPVRDTAERERAWPLILDFFDRTLAQAPQSG